MNLPVVKSAVGTPRRAKYIRSIDQLRNIPPEERERLRRVAERYVFRANEYYRRAH